MTSIILQSDCSILLDVSVVESKDVEKSIQRFAEHTKTIGCFEHYIITPLSIWNALALGISNEKILAVLQKNKKYPLPIFALHHIQVWLDRFDKLTLRRIDEQDCILTGDKQTLQHILCLAEINKLIAEANIEQQQIKLPIHHRGLLKQVLVRECFNVIDECGFDEGENLAFEMLKYMKHTKQAFQLRDYQRKAIAAFHRDKIGGSGVIVLPCGTGKTLTGIGVMASLQCATLIITSNTISCEQWKEELLNKTSLTEDQVGIYGGHKREVKPITIATYHILSYRHKRQAVFPHMSLFSKRNWGLIIYDEVHLLPAPVFRMTASIQATRRLGLTATLIREDGCAPDVYSLVGAKLFDLQWKEAEQQHVIAQVNCIEIHIPLSNKQQRQYESMNKREQYKFSSTNPSKLDVITFILERHIGEQVLIIGQYIDQLQIIANQLKAPLVTGQTSHSERQAIFELFRLQKTNVLVLSKIANLALNLPNASVAIQVSGSYGSRQEEAQRIGRVIRPKLERNVASFYTLVTSGSIEEQFSLNRGRFMEEQGYTYEVFTVEQFIMDGGERVDQATIN